MNIKQQMNFDERDLRRNDETGSPSETESFQTETSQSDTSQADSSHAFLHNF